MPESVQHQFVNHLFKCEHLDVLQDISVHEDLFNFDFDRNSENFSKDDVIRNYNELLNLDRDR